MKICVIDSWPNLKFSAEREFIRRLCIAAKRMDIECVPVVTSEEIVNAEPELVLASHEFSAKLTSYNTIGLMWSPPTFYRNDKKRIRSILSYDGYLVGSEQVKTFISDLLHGLPRSVEKPCSDFYFLPSCQRWLNRPATRIGGRSLMYAGIHWDGMRHGGLFYKLHQMGILNCYGPSDSWTHVRGSYHGTIPFDGDSLMNTIHKHGISLCIHKKEHRKANTPSMRLFEAAAAENLIITDDMCFAKKTFGDTAFYLDAHMTEAEKAYFIKDKVEWANAHPHDAADMAIASREIFERNWALEVLLPKVCQFGDSLSIKSSFAKDVVQALNKPSLDVIIRCGSRPEKVVLRAIDCVLNQANVDSSVILVDYSDGSTFSHLSDHPSKRIKHVPSRRTGYRSTALWDGLKNVGSDYFAVLDDDDTVGYSHWYELINALENDSFSSQPLMAYCGVIRIEEDGALIDAINFSGPLSMTINETKELKFLDFFDPDRLLVLDNYIQSNAWVARKSILNKLSLDDPLLIVAEDMYLYLEMLFHTDFVFVPRQTANWHWRSKSEDNSMLKVDQETWQACIERIFYRLDNKILRNLTFKSARISARSHIESNILSSVDSYKPLVFDWNAELQLHAINATNQYEGFHASELHGIWTDSDFAWFVGYFHDFVDCVSVSMSIQLPPHFSGRDQKADVFINGIPVFSDLAPQWKTMNIDQRVEFKEPLNSLTVLLICESIFQPSEHGESCDDRKLGIHVSRFMVTPAERIPLSDNIESNLDAKGSKIDPSHSFLSKPMGFYLTSAISHAKHGNYIKALDLVSEFIQFKADRGIALKNTESLLIEKIKELCDPRD
jgi:hypothetical protein